jgi:DNA-binding transcriptional MocR family regulator
MSFQTIGPDKVNQLRHLRYIKNAENLKKIMMDKAEIIRPKFERVLSILNEEFAGSGICQWNNPRGGYFISLNVPNGCATKAVGMCKQAGVLFTGAGATFPYKKDPNDRNIRIAPTVPTIDEIETAVRMLSICVKIAYLEKQLA